MLHEMQMKKKLCVDNDAVKEKIQFSDVSARSENGDDVGPVVRQKVHALKFRMQPAYVPKLMRREI